MINIFLVRHGETTWNRKNTYQGSTNVPLNERGLKQAILCAKALKDHQFSKILTSDLSRALTTATTIAQYHPKAEFIVDIRLREINFGDWEGLTYEQISEKWPGMIEEMYANSANLQLPNGESFVQMQDRAWLAIKDGLKNLNDGDNILIVCHGGTNRALICKALNMSLKHAWNFRQGNTAISHIEYYDDGDFNTLQLLNDTSHIDCMEGENICG